jgi:signal transduction histidine kinase
MPHLQLSMVYEALTVHYQGNVMVSSRLTEDEKAHRRQLTEYAIRLTLLAAAVGLVLELFFYLLILSPEQWSADRGLHLLISVTAIALGVLALMLGVNRLKNIPYWVGSTAFLLALTVLTLFSDTPDQVTNGRATMIFMIPILLSGVLMHAYATFVFTSIVLVLLAAYSFVIPGIALNPFNVIFFYMFSGLVSIVLRSLEKSTYQVRREAAQSETILSALRGGYILTDRDHRILRLNERTCSILPLASQDANLLDVIKDPNIPICDEDRKRLVDVVTDIGTDEVHVKVSDRDYFAANIYIPSNREHLIFLRDITAEMEIDRLKDTALAMVSHELRTPLTAIRGHAEMALREPYTAVSNATRILLNTQRLLIMVENLLSQSRLRTGKTKNIPAPTNIQTVFRVVYSLLASEAKEKKLEFEMSVDENIPILMVDAVLLQQILTNLACNAIKFTSTGKIRMTATMPDPEHWNISVSDTGPGIPAPKRAEIFKEFFQAEAGSVYARPHQGTGLGLSIVKGLVEQMDGTLTLQSEEDVGSSFSICFPLMIPKEITRKRKQNG